MINKRRFGVTLPAEKINKAVNQGMFAIALRTIKEMGFDISDEYMDKAEKGYTYLSSDYQPFGEFGETGYKDGARDGFYYNGGSWCRAEYCAYVVGQRHVWNKANIYMENRI